MKGFRARTQKSGKVFYYFDTGAKPRREIPLGGDYVMAVRKWSELIGAQAVAVTDFADLADKYLREEIPLKAKSTQATYRSDLKHLRAFFCNPTPAPLDQILPEHIGMLLDRHKATPTTANRLKRLFSTMFNKARRWGYTKAENPVAGIEGHDIPKSVRPISDAVYQAVWSVASESLRDAMDLAYLTGQRPGDVLQYNERQIDDGYFIIESQNKTGKPLRIRIEGEFAELIERITTRKAGYKVWSSALCVNTRGLPMTKQTLRDHFETARATAAEQHPKLADQIRRMWFTKLRSKAADDVADTRGEQAASDLLGHDDVRTTRRHYLTRGKRVGPTR